MNPKDLAALPARALAALKTRVDGIKRARVDAPEADIFGGHRELAENFTIKQMSHGLLQWLGYSAGGIVSGDALTIAIFAAGLLDVLDVGALIEKMAAVGANDFAGAAYAALVSAVGGDAALGGGGAASEAAARAAARPGGISVSLIVAGLARWIGCSGGGNASAKTLCLAMLAARLAGVATVGELRSKMAGAGDTTFAEEALEALRRHGAAHAGVDINTIVAGFALWIGRSDGGNASAKNLCLAMLAARLAGVATVGALSAKMAGAGDTTFAEEALEALRRHGAAHASVDITTIVAGFARWIGCKAGGDAAAANQAALVKGAGAAARSHFAWARKPLGGP